MGIRNRLARLESARTGITADLVDGLYVVCDDGDQAPAPGAVLLATDGTVETWRLPDGSIERVKQI